MSRKPPVPGEVWVSTVKPFDHRSYQLREYGRNHWRMPLRLGVLDEAATFAYTNGQCHSLAAALAEATGWPVVVTLLRHGSEALVEHCFVQERPDSWVDVVGRRSPQQWTERRLLYSGERRDARVTDASGVRQLARREAIVGEAPLLPPNMRAARALVPALMAQLKFNTSSGLPFKLAQAPISGGKRQ